LSRNFEKRFASGFGGNNRLFLFVIGTVRAKENCSFRGIIIIKWKKQNPILGETKSVESIQGHRDTSPIARIKWFSLFF
jgi:hypothetical protein